MITTKIFLKSLAYIIIICFLLPLLKIGATTSVKLDWLFVKIALFYIVLNSHNLVRFKLYRKYILICLGIFIITILSNYIGGYYYLDNLNNLRMPTTIILIVDRIVTFVFFSYLVINKIIKYDSFIRIIQYVFIISLVFGFCQYFELFGLRDIALNYYMEEGGVQEINFSMFNRILGVAPAIITWGGLCVMMFHFFYFLSKDLVIKSIGIFLSVFNVLVAASRAAIVSLFVSFFLVLVIKIVVIDKNYLKLINVFVVSAIGLLTVFFLLNHFVPDQVEFLMHRFESSEDALTKTGRGAQLEYFGDLLEQDYFGIFIGMGDSKIVEYGFLEVDYAYIFYSFGIFGFVLHYLLLVFLIKKVYELRYLSSKMFLFVIAATITYLIFSIGFYFFYELYMGLPYWWLVGLCYGELQRRKWQVNFIN